MNVDAMMVILIFPKMEQFAKRAAKKLIFIVIKVSVEDAHSDMI